MRKNLLVIFVLLILGTKLLPVQQFLAMVRYEILQNQDINDNDSDNQEAGLDMLKTLKMGKEFIDFTHISPIVHYTICNQIFAVHVQEQAQNPFIPIQVPPPLA